VGHQRQEEDQRTEVWGILRRFSSTRRERRSLGGTGGGEGTHDRTLSQDDGGPSRTDGVFARCAASYFPLIPSIWSSANWKICSDLASRFQR